MKMFAVFKREYFQVVRKKSFLILTVLTPFLLGGLMVIPAVLAMKGLGGKRVALVDGTDSLSAAVEDEWRSELSPPRAADAVAGRARTPLDLSIEYVPARREPEATLRECLARTSERGAGSAERLDGVLAVPGDALTNSKARLTYYTRSAADFLTQERLARLVNRALFRERLGHRGISPAEIERLLQPAPVESVQLSQAGERRKAGAVSFLGALVFGLLLLVPTLLYGQEIMRGIVQEKSDRVVEILISSMSARELLTGKVLGLAAAGLTQVSIWLAMAVAAAAAFAFGGAPAAFAGIPSAPFVNARVMIFFLVFYVLAYLVYACSYAVGGAISNSDKEAQQVLAPLVVMLMIPWILAIPIIQNPQARLAVVLSLVPVFTPITMFLRIVVSEPPAWQIALSIALSIGTIYILFLITAKIFRVGILSYGKRPTIPELWRWLRLA